MQKLISWVEIPAVDFNRALDFYTKVLKIKFEVVNSEKEQMACFPTGEGAISFSPGFKPSEDGVLISINTENDLEGTLDRIETCGGKTLIPKTKIEAEGRGYFATFVDSEGNRIGLYGN